LEGLPAYGPICAVVKTGSAATATVAWKIRFQAPREMVRALGARENTAMA